MGPVISNVGIFAQIAHDAILEMRKTKPRTRRSHGEEEVVFFDPSQRSFKAALTHIVFSGMWLEAKLHLEIAKKFGAKKAMRTDRFKYEQKLRLLGVEDLDLFDQIERFRELRRALVHEKAHDPEQRFLIAQDEAETVDQLMRRIDRLLRPTGMN